MNRASFAHYAGNLELMVEFLNLVKDHDNVMTKHKEAMNQYYLTEDQKKDYEDYKGSIAKNKQILDDILTEKEKLQDLKTHHDKKIQEIKDKQAEVDKYSSSIQNEKKLVDASKKGNDETSAQIFKDRAELRVLSEDLDQRKTKLDEFEKSLNARAERVLAREKASGL